MRMVADTATEDPVEQADRVVDVDITEDDLVADLGRLLREGLVAVVVEEADEDLIPRFRVTARGLEACHTPVTGPVTP